MQEKAKSLRSRRDFASKNSGAIVLRSDPGVKNANSILSRSNDDYLLVPGCDENSKEVIIHLSEEVGVEEILADNHEDFSASFDEITFYGESDYPPQNNKWKKIGVMRPQKGINYYLAEIDPQYKQDRSMIRYLRLLMQGTQGNELYCTLTHVQVYGRSMHASLKESFKAVNSKNNSTQPEKLPDSNSTRVKNDSHCEFKHPMTFQDYL